MIPKYNKLKENPDKEFNLYQKEDSETKNAEPLDLKKLDPLVLKTIEDLKKIWKENKNENAFLFACYVIKNPYFIADEVTRTPKIKISTRFKKTLVDRLIGKLMNNNKTTTGLKLKTYNLVKKVLDKRPAGLTMSQYLLYCLVKSVPNNDIRRQKYGSGYLTRAVKLTVYRKISWFTQVLFDLVKSKRPRNSLEKILKTEFEDLAVNSSRSTLLAKKRESEQNAARSNIQ